MYLLNKLHNSFPFIKRHRHFLTFIFRRRFHFMGFFITLVVFFLTLRASSSLEELDSVLLVSLSITFTSGFDFFFFFFGVLQTDAPPLSLSLLLGDVLCCLFLLSFKSRVLFLCFLILHSTCSLSSSDDCSNFFLCLLSSGETDLFFHLDFTYFFSLSAER